jgi:phage/plasmid-like protein (TIGR03299 family)
MAHEIDMSNKRANIAFVGEVPWHGLGQPLTAGAPIEVWKKEAGMDHRIIHTPAMFEVGGQMHEFEGKRTLYRSDTKAPLSIVSDSYKIVQPGEILEFFRDLVGVSGMELETAGCLFGGTRYWALANTKHEEDVIKNDRVKGMLLLTTSCDGTLATTAKFTSVRVVCNNTLRVAMHHENDSMKDRPTIKVGHNSVFDPNKIKDALGLIDHGWSSFITDIRKMAHTKMTDAGAKKFFANIMLNAEQLEEFKKEEAIHARVQAKLDKMFNMYKGEGMGADMVTGTVWGALNTVTEFADHNIGKIADNMLWNSWFGFGENLKNKAHEQALELI